MFGPASALVMLYANLIRSLHIIAKHYGPEKYEKWHKGRHSKGAELNKLVSLLEDICGQELDVFSEPRVKDLLFKSIRLLRNDFLHGKWEDVENRLVGMNIKGSFEMVSRVFGSLEEKFDEGRLLSSRIERLA